MYYTYVLQSMTDMNFYTGSTKDLKLRFEEHKKGNVDSTKDRRPIKLVYYEACIDANDARKREKYLKTYHGKMYLKRRLKSYLTGWMTLWWIKNLMPISIDNRFFTKSPGSWRKKNKSVDGSGQPFTIQEVSEKLGITKHTLRFWEKELFDRLVVTSLSI